MLAMRQRRGQLEARFANMPPRLVGTRRALARISSAARLTTARRARRKIISFLQNYECCIIV
jgi:hypothetical protein